MTGLDLISSAMRLIGVLASGETPSANESTDGLASLNQLLDSWSTESLLIPTKVREVFPLVSGKQTYTMGTGGDFATSRPMRIENAELQITSVTPYLELPMSIWTKDQYAGVIIKSLTSTYPQGIYSDNAYPLASINVWPVPTQVNNLVLYSWKPLANITSLTTVLSLPSGYQRALKYALALELAPEYGKAVPEAVAINATDSKASIKRMNHQPKYLRVEDAVLAKPGVWDWRTGESS